MSYTRLLQPLCACSLKLLNQKKWDDAIWEKKKMAPPNSISATMGAGGLSSTKPSL